CSDATWRRRKRVRIFGIDAALDGVAGDYEVILRIAEPLSFGNANLISHDVGKRHHFCHGMFYLNASIHLHEVKTVVLIEKEFKGACTGIANLLTGLDGGISHFGAQLWGQDRGRRLLKKFLVPALNRTLALAQMNTVSVFIGEYLNLDVSWFLDKPLDEHT